jgi:hypothetical protein
MPAGDIAPARRAEIAKVIDGYVKAFQIAELDERIARVLSSAAVDVGNHVISGVGRPIIPLSIANQRVTLLLLQPVDKPPTGCVGARFATLRSVVTGSGIFETAGTCAPSRAKASRGGGDRCVRNGRRLLRDDGRSTRVENYSLWPLRPYQGSGAASGPGRRPSGGSFPAFWLGAASVVAERRDGHGLNRISRRTCDVERARDQRDRWREAKHTLPDHR